MGDDLRHELDEAVDHPADIDPEAEVVIGISRFEHRAFQTDPGVVDEDVDAAELVLHPIGGLAVFLAVGHVELQRADSVRLPAAGELGQRVVDVVLPEVGDYHLGAALD